MAGIYNDLCGALAERIAASHAVSAEVIPSNGSEDNSRLLVGGDVHLAPMQALNEDLCVVAPLFYEKVHVLVRQDAPIQTIREFRGRRVAVGPRGSGSRATAELVLETLGLNLDREVIAWKDLDNPGAPDAALICIGRGSPLVSRLLAEQRWRLLPIPQASLIAKEHPILRTMTIESDEFPHAELGQGSIQTVGTTAILAAREDAPAELVVAALHALYQRPRPLDNLFPRERANEWRSLALHPAARGFYFQPRP